VRGGREAPKVAASLARLVLGSFFNRIEVVGFERLPEDGPVLFVANHNNGLVDPLLILGFLPRRPRFLAKSVLWKNPLLGWLFDWGGVIPVYRPQDRGVDTSRNSETFVRCHEVLAEGGSIALFPEGRSHDEPSLSSLRTGAARIALGAEEAHGPLAVKIAPVGLHFDEKTTFRSRALVVVGPVLDLEGEEGVEGVRQLTSRIDDGLREVSHDWASWEDAHWVSRAVDIASRSEPRDLPGEEPMARQFAEGKNFLQGLRDLRRSHPERLEALRGALGDYDGMLRLFGLRDDQVASTYPTRSILAYLFATGFRLLLRLPFAAIALAFSWLPYRMVGLVARRFADAPDEEASYKVYSALALYPMFWAMESLGVGLWLGGLWGWIAFLAAPVCSYLSLDFEDRRNVLVHEAGAFLRLRNKGLDVELLSRRRKVSEEISSLVEFYLSLEASQQGAVEPRS
jgi:glycerol-3-phosphate O-acyltransferase/dihydroxyacetone phosphate acyltransferase